MTKFMRILCSASARRGAMGVVAIACVAGCGQRGPLYMPTDPAAANRATLPETLIPFGGPGIPTPMTSTLSTQPAPPLSQDSPAGGSGTGTASPVQQP